MKPKGFILVEFLVASILFTLAGSGLYTTLTQGLKAEARIQEGFQSQMPFVLLWERIEKDLRNSVTLRDYPFKGKNGEISFPAFLEKRLVLVRYYVQEKKLIRAEEKLPEKLRKEKPTEKVLLRNLESFQFEFSYRDEEERLCFEPFWLEEPYQGIPRGVRVEIVIEGVSRTKMISIPQGELGKL